MVIRNIRPRSSSNSPAGGGEKKGGFSMKIAQNRAAKEHGPAGRPEDRAGRREDATPADSRNAPAEAVRRRSPPRRRRSRSSSSSRSRSPPRRPVEQTMTGAALARMRAGNRPKPPEDALTGAALARLRAAATQPRAIEAPPPCSSGSRVETRVVLVTDAQAKVVIGKGGDRIKELRRETRATIEIVQMMNVLATRLTIIGDVPLVLAKIQELLVATNTPCLDNVPHPHGSIEISPEMERLFVGPNRSVIDELKRDWLRDDTKLNVLPPSVPGGNYAIMLVGPHESVEEGKALVCGKLHELSNLHRVPILRIKK